jgi:hypothetical protein
MFSIKLQCGIYYTILIPHVQTEPFKFCCWILVVPPILQDESAELTTIGRCEWLDVPQISSTHKSWDFRIKPAKIGIEQQTIILVSPCYTNWMANRLMSRPQFSGGKHRMRRIESPGGGPMTSSWRWSAGGMGVTPKWGWPELGQLGSVFAVTLLISMGKQQKVSSNMCSL